jgi:3-hydroxybutyrate dehydrogenase
LKGQSTVAAGSTSGIGLGIAIALAEAGANVMLNGFGDAAEIERMRADLARRCNVRVMRSGADMSKPDQVMAMVREAEERFGRLDVLVNNAGIQRKLSSQFVAAVDECPGAKWEQIIAINLSSNFYAIKGALPGMKARKQGHIVNIASAHGLVASPFKSAHVAAKHGVLGLTKAVALEVAETRITCNAV